MPPYRGARKAVALFRRKYKPSAFVKKRPRVGYANTGRVSYGPSLATLAPRSFGSNWSRMPIRREVKQVDTLTAVPISTTGGAGYLNANTCINATQQGSGKQNRIGNAIKMMNVDIKLRVAPTTITVPSGQCSLRAVVVLDRQWNGATVSSAAPAYTDLFQAADQAGTALTATVNTPRFAGNINRYKILASTRIELPFLPGTGNTGVSSVPSAKEVSFRVNLTQYPRVDYKASSSPNALSSDIATGALIVMLAWFPNDTSAPTASTTQIPNAGSNGLNRTITMITRLNYMDD